MSHPIETFAEKSFPLPGVAACATRLPDRSLRTKCYNDWFSKEQLEQMLARLALAADSLAYHRIQPTRLCWSFENALLLIALRRDGACLLCILENRAGLASAQVEGVLDQFLALI